MSITIETILSRMMNEPEFADVVFADTEKALAEYKLSAEELERFQQISRADFEALTGASPETRQSMVVGNYFDGRFLRADDLAKEQG